MKRGKLPPLSKRLEAVKEMVGTCNTFADIGSDHALLPIRMVAEDLCGSAIVTDLRKGPLETAAGNIERYCPEKRDRFSLRQGSGLSVLKKGEADVKAICGMGGLLIAEIIAADLDISAEGRLILQPNTSLPELRVFLWGKGFSIKNEAGILDAGHAYALMDCVYTGEKRTVSRNSIEAIAGEYIGRKDDKSGIPYLKALEKKYAAALEKITCADDSKDFKGKSERRAELERTIEEIRRITGT